VDGQIQNGKSDQHSDLDLVAAINSGDVVAFEVLYLRYRDWVVGLACRVAGNDDLAMCCRRLFFMC
jgi:hypothetical protein